MGSPLPGVFASLGADIIPRQIAEKKDRPRMNERLCKVCAALDETERNRDRGPFTGRDP